MTGKPTEGSSEHFIATDLRPGAPADDGQPQDAGAPLADRLSNALVPLLAAHPDITISQDGSAPVMETVFRPAGDVIAAAVDGETVLLNLRTGYYYSINRVGSAIWDSLDGTRRLRDIVDTLCNRYVVPEAQLSADVLAFAQQLLSQGLIVAA